VINFARSTGTGNAPQGRRASPPVPFLPKSISHRASTPLYGRFLLNMMQLHARLLSPFFLHHYAKHAQKERHKQSHVATVTLLLDRDELHAAHYPALNQYILLLNVDQYIFP
jgi:hypothetical protein